MLMCDITKTPPYVRHFINSELLLIANRDVSIRFNGKDNNVMLESPIKIPEGIEDEH